MANPFRSILESLRAGLRQLNHRRLTLRYPEQKLELPGYYTFDPKLAVAKPGYKGRHILWLDKCTGCQLCSIACENIAQAIEMVKVSRTQANNKKSIFPQIDYGKCVFCGLCVDACPFYALGMTEYYNLAAYEKKDLVYSPEKLGIPPKRSEGLVQLRLEPEVAYHE